MKTIKCPICKGRGELRAPSKRPPKSALPPKWIMAQALKDVGYSHGEIVKLLGWRSKNSVTHALRMLKNNRRRIVRNGPP